MTDNQDIVCKMQRGEKVSPEWCLLSQYAELCRDCQRNNGVLYSDYQESERRESGLPEIKVKR